MKIAKLAMASALGLAIGISSSANAAIVADIVWVVDRSGSMGGDIAQVKQRIAEFDTAMTSKGINANYGLVRFGGAASLIQDITDYTTFIAAGGPFQTLIANGGGTEDGSAAIQTAMTASFRANSVRNIVLVTDENDDNSANRQALNDALVATTENELINIIGNPNDDDSQYYANLATNNGGKFFNILSFRADPAPFFTNFVETKVKEIIVDFCTANPTAPECNPTVVSEPGALGLLSLSLGGALFIRRNRKLA